jgi:hypothetical protein
MKRSDRFGLARPSIVEFEDTPVKDDDVKGAEDRAEVRQRAAREFFPPRVIKKKTGESFPSSPVISLVHVELAFNSARAKVPRSSGHVLGGLASMYKELEALGARRLYLLPPPRALSAACPRTWKNRGRRTPAGSPLPPPASPRHLPPSSPRGRARRFAAAGPVPGARTRSRGAPPPRAR